ncbi:MAG: MOSC domain-containing protein [Actinomycetota bacterium]
MSSTLGHLVSVNVGAPRTTIWQDREVESSIWKEPVAGPRRVEGVNVVGDDQANREVHGGESKAVYAYSSADAAWWAAELGRELSPGIFGENLTVDGPDTAGAVVGERWRIGSVTLRVTEPRIPCSKLAMRFEDPAMTRRFADAARPGTYLGIAEAGTLEAGDAIELLDRPDHGLTVSHIERTYHRAADHLDAILACPDVSETWLTWARRQADRKH